MRIVICDGERSRAVLTPCSVRDVDSHGQIHIVAAISDIESHVVAASLSVNEATRASDGVLAPPSGDKACIAGGAGLREVVATDEIDVTTPIAVEGEDGIIEQG